MPTYPSPQEDALQRGVMPRVTDHEGNTLLHAACGRGALRAAKLVVRWAVYSTHPPDRNFLNLQSATGYTALDLARGGGFHKMEEWLIALGALGRGGTGAGTLAGVPSSNLGGGGHPRVTPTRHHHAGPRHPPPSHPSYPAPHGGGYAGTALPHAHGTPYGTPHLPYGAVGVMQVGGGGSYGTLGYGPGPAVSGGGYESYDAYGGGSVGSPHAGGYGSDGSEHRIHAPAGPSFGTDGDYLMGALEAALGGGGGNRTGGGLGSESRRRAQAVARQVAEALEDREDLADELEEAREGREAAEARVAALEAEAESARAQAEAAVIAARDEERSAVLAALGLAEQRAVQMAAECETLREEREALAAALEYVSREAEALRVRTSAAEAEARAAREEGYRSGFAAGLFSRTQDEDAARTLGKAHREALGLTHPAGEAEAVGEAAGARAHRCTTADVAAAAAAAEAAAAASRADSGGVVDYAAAAAAFMKSLVSGGRRADEGGGPAFSPLPTTDEAGDHSQAAADAAADAAGDHSQAAAPEPSARGASSGGKDAAEGATGRTADVVADVAAAAGAAAVARAAAAAAAATTTASVPASTVSFLPKTSPTKQQHTPWRQGAPSASTQTVLYAGGLGRSVIVEAPRVDRDRPSSAASSRAGVASSAAFAQTLGGQSGDVAQTPARTSAEDADATEAGSGNDRGVGAEVGSGDSAGGLFSDTDLSIASEAVAAMERSMERSMEGLDRSMDAHERSMEGVTEGEIAMARDDDGSEGGWSDLEPDEVDLVGTAQCRDGGPLRDALGGLTLLDEVDTGHDAVG